MFRSVCSLIQVLHNQRVVFWKHQAKPQKEIRTNVRYLEWNKRKNKKILDLDKLRVRGLSSDPNTADSLSQHIFQLLIRGHIIAKHHDMDEDDVDPPPLASISKLKRVYDYLLFWLALTQIKLFFLSMNVNKLKISWNKLNPGKIPLQTGSCTLLVAWWPSQLASTPSSWAGLAHFPRPLQEVLCEPLLAGTGRMGVLLVLLGIWIGDGVASTWQWCEKKQ